MTSRSARRWSAKGEVAVSGRPDSSQTSASVPRPICCPRSGGDQVKCPGSQRAVAEVCSGEAIGVSCIEASRLAWDVMYGFKVKWVLTLCRPLAGGPRSRMASEGFPARPRR